MGLEKLNDPLDGPLGIINGVSVLNQNYGLGIRPLIRFLNESQSRGQLRLKQIARWRCAGILIGKHRREAIKI